MIARMTRLGEFDLPDRLAPVIPPVITSIGFGLACCGLIFIIRVMIDMVVPGGAPFALLFPAAVLGTLVGRWLAGVTASTISILYIWYVNFPVAYSFRFENREGLYSLIVVTLSCAFVIVVAEIFRRSVRRVAAERDREIAERDLFLAEVEHRVKNNFAVVASLIELQRRRAPDEASQEALAAALARVESIARAHRHLYRDASAGTVGMRDYLTELSTALADALFLRAAITLSCESDEIAMPRDRAVSIGLVVNELVTNAAKHAFTGRDRGSISVELRETAEGSLLVVSDDGIGLPETPAKREDGSGLGQRLLEAFARQAGGVLATDSDALGTRVTLALSR